MSGNKTAKLEKQQVQLERLQRLTAWNDLAREIKLPMDLYAAVFTGRTELLKLAARDMTKVEVSMMLDLVACLLETNHLLQQHSRDVSQQTEQLRGHFIGLSASVDRLRLFSDFRDPSSVEDEDE